MLESNHPPFSEVAHMMRHPSLQVRPFEQRDTNAVATLLADRLSYDAVTPGWVREKTLDDPDHDPDLTLCALDAAHLAGFAQGIIRDVGSEKRGWFKWFATAAEYEGRGIMTNLCDQIEDTMRRRGVKWVGVANSPPNYTWPGLDPRYTSAYAFLERRGYRRTGDAFNMTCDLTAHGWDTSGDEERLASEGIGFRRGERRDLEPTLDHLRAHFPHWVREAATCFRRSPISLHIAVDGTKVAGFAAYDANNLNMAWFGPMGTDPAYRKKGIGKVLLWRCLRDQKAQGNRTAIIPWVGPLAFYYHHCGAVVSRIFWKMAREL